MARQRLEVAQIDVDVHPPRVCRQCTCRRRHAVPGVRQGGTGEQQADQLPFGGEAQLRQYFLFGVTREVAMGEIRRQGAQSAIGSGEESDGK